VSEFEQIPFGSSEFADNPELRCFRDLFLWLSSSRVSASRWGVGQDVPLIPPGWARV